MKISKVHLLSLFWIAAALVGFVIPMACTNTSSNFSPTFPTTPVVLSATATNAFGFTSTPTFTIPPTSTITNTPTYAPAMTFQSVVCNPTEPNGLAIGGSPVSIFVAGGDGNLSTYQISGSGTPKVINSFNSTLFSTLYGVAVDSTGKYYVLDYGNNAVYEFDSSNSDAAVTTWNNYNGMNFNQPEGIAVNSAGTTLYVADTGNDVVDVFNVGSTGSPATPIVSFNNQWYGNGSGNSNFTDPTGIAINSSGTTIYLADTGDGVIQAFSPSGAYLNQFPMLPGADIDTGLSVDGSGDIYAADYNNAMVEDYNTANSPVTMNAQWNGPTNPANLFGPDGVAFYSGTLYVADYDNNAIYAVTP